LSARKVRNQLREARDRGAGLVVISEDLDELIELSTEIVVLLCGRIVGGLATEEADTQSGE